MKKSLYARTARKGKEVFFYLCSIGRSELSIIMESKEAQYWRVRDTLQQYVDLGCFNSVFSKGTVFCERVAREDIKDLSQDKRRQIIEKIKRNFKAITWDELAHLVKSKGASLEEFFITEKDLEDDDDFIELKKILPLKEISVEEYFFRAVNDRFPFFADKLQKEFKSFEKEVEIV